MRLRFSFLAAALVCGVTAGSAAGAAAPAGASFALRPVLSDPALAATKSYFIVATKPGAVVQDRVRIVNTGGKTGTAILYAVDATTGRTSGAVYLSRNAMRRGVGAWISIAQPKVTLAPGKDAIVPFTVHVPRSARPGDHLGAIVAENAQLQTSSGGARRIRIRHVTITAVELQLPGHAVGRVIATGVRVGGGHGDQRVYVQLRNTGTVLIRPAATLIVRDGAGQVVARRSVQLDTFVPGTAIDYPAFPKRALKPGTYTVEVRMRSSADGVPGYRTNPAQPYAETGTFPFTVTTGAPPAAHAGSKHSTLSAGVLALLALLAIAVAVFLLVRRRARKGGEAVRSAATPSPAPLPDEPTFVAETAVAEEKEEVPAWAGLIAAYDSKPRQETNGSAAEHGDVELVPVAAAVPPPEVEEYEPEPRTAGPVDLGVEEMKQLIIRHDLAVAEAKLRAQKARSEPAPAENGATESSPTLVDATLIALTTLAATRPLKND